MNRFMLLYRTVTLIFLVAGPAAAHHGAGVYDRSLSVSVTGEVTQFHFVNPHVLIYIDVEDNDGSHTEWSGELTSPNRLARMGIGTVRWHKDLLEPGDVITLTGNPARNGAPALLLNRVENAAGEPLLESGR
jgi:hypothetical protein